MFKVGDKVEFMNIEATILGVHLKTGDLLVQDENGKRITVLQSLCKPVEKANGEARELRSGRSS